LRILRSNWQWNTLPFLVALPLCFAPMVFGAQAVNWKEIHSWKDLTETKVSSSPDLHYYELQTSNGSNAFLVVANYGRWHLLAWPVVNHEKGNTSSAAASSGALAAVNGGYFNLSNGESASYVTINGKLECDPTLNKDLAGNPKLKPFLPAIFNRSELRFTADKKGDMHISIANHRQKLGNGERLVHALQAGPRLLPDITAGKEAFVRTESDGKSVDSIGVNKTAARTAFGFTADEKQIMILCVSSKRQDEFSSGVTLAEVASMLKALGCSQAINFDGGTSTTMVVQEGNREYKMVCGRTPETMVKTALVVYRP
jgi:exopolysaccharide biosynthesis protein